MAQRTCASRSFSEKYQWPEAGAEKFDSSPSSHSSRQARFEQQPHLAIEARDGVDVALGAAEGRRAADRAGRAGTQPAPLRGRYGSGHAPVTMARHRLLRRRSLRTIPHALRSLGHACEFSKKR